MHLKSPQIIQLNIPSNCASQNLLNCASQKPLKLFISYYSGTHVLLKLLRYSFLLNLLSYIFSTQTTRYSFSTQTTRYSFSTQTTRYSFSTQTTQVLIFYSNYSGTHFLLKVKPSQLLIMYWFHHFYSESTHITLCPWFSTEFLLNF